MTATDRYTGLYTSPLIEYGRYKVFELCLDEEKLARLWYAISQFRTLFSDITRGDLANFVRYVTDGDSVWLEIHDETGIIGVVVLEHMFKIVDADAHIIFFTRDYATKEKVDLCKQVMKWVFSKFPLQRVTVDVPTIYRRTIRLVRDMGFKLEGVRRRAVLIGGNWLDIELYGVLREEVFRREEAK